MKPLSNDNTDPDHNVSDAETPSFIEHYFGFSTWKFAGALVGVVLAALYISNLLFGNASLEVLMQLESYEKHLKKEIVRLKQENAKLQKEYFELKELEPSE